MPLKKSCIVSVSSAVFRKKPAETLNCVLVTIIAPENPSTSEKVARIGMTTTDAMSRGTTSFLMGSAPRA
jgi:hypothetical protein